jgi:hypothetical protein
VREATLSFGSDTAQDTGSRFHLAFPGTESPEIADGRPAGHHGSALGSLPTWGWLEGSPPAQVAAPSARRPVTSERRKRSPLSRSRPGQAPSHQQIRREETLLLLPSHPEESRITGSDAGHGQDSGRGGGPRQHAYLHMFIEPERACGLRIHPDHETDGDSRNPSGVTRHGARRRSSTVRGRIVSVERVSCPASDAVQRTAAPVSLTMRRRSSRLSVHGGRGRG